jgi:hypothetical protein
MRPEDLQSANDVLAAPRDVDAVVSKRLGLHVISRLAYRYSIQVLLTSTSGSGITAVVLLPPELFAAGQLTRSEVLTGTFTPAVFPPQRETPAAAPRAPRRMSSPEPEVRVDVLDPHPDWGGWWESDDGSLAVRALPSTPSPHVGPSPQFEGSQFEGSRFEAPVFEPMPFHATAVRPSPAVNQRTGQARPAVPAAAATAPVAGATAAAAPGAGANAAPDPGSHPAAGQISLGATTTSAPQTPPTPVASTPVLSTPAPPTPVPSTPVKATPVPATGSIPITAAGTARLNQRTPQTHLAPELQRGSKVSATPAPAPIATGPDAVRAREALSRYQASRQAALAEHDPATKDHS